MKYQVLSSGQAEFVLALARRIVPEIAELGADEQWGVVRVIDGALAARPRALQFQIKFFLRMIQFSTLPWHGKSLNRLAPELQDRWLHRFQDSPIPRIRTGMWGLKTLVFMGYYGNPDRWLLFHYAPVLDGNEKLHDR